uniref:Uncharacterized protein n=1 Tax=Acrobeloides nanus TaxID=290746 RepID=A0A914EGG4_9BILA
MSSGLRKPGQISDELSDDCKKRNEEIEDEIMKEMINNKRVVQILLLGTSDSGKSTIAKQMRSVFLDKILKFELVKSKRKINEK